MNDKIPNKKTREAMRELEGVETFEGLVVPKMRVRSKMEKETLCATSECNGTNCCECIFGNFNSEEFDRWLEREAK